MSDELRPTWLDSADGVREAASQCGESGRFALDTEADSLHSYFHKVCLVQLSAAGSYRPPSAILTPYRKPPHTIISRPVQIARLSVRIVGWSTPDPPLQVSVSGS